ncbi:epidermal differentiation-specific protein-like [Aquarana catesbeiana]|uniref:epidermal differentiation-specific protein-like n=1 Tax=Aquarana catesbeiana TaxID=8400 RepID=UPI003CC94010
MNALELFELPDFKGDFVSIEQDTKDLTSVGFLQRARSLKVHGDPWIVFTGISYEGKFKCYLEGSYPSIPALEKKISSVRVVRDGLYNPSITLFEHIYYGGKTVTLEKAANSLKPYGFDNMASSQNNVSGAWILYSEEYYKGEQKVTVAGDDIPDYHKFGWGDKVSSLKPLEPHEASEALE